MAFTVVAGTSKCYLPRWCTICCSAVLLDMTEGFNAPRPVNIVNGTHPQLVAFLVLNMWPSHLGLPVLLAIIFFKKVDRHPTFVNLCITFMIVGMQVLSHHIA